MAMKAMKVAKAAAPRKSTAMKAMKKQATKFKHTTWTYVNVENIRSCWIRIDHYEPKVQVTCYTELGAMVAIK